MSGIAFLIAGIASFLQYPFLEITSKLFGGRFLVIDLLQLLTILLSFSFPIYLMIRKYKIMNKFF